MTKVAMAGLAALSLNLVFGMQAVAQQPESAEPAEVKRLTELLNETNSRLETLEIEILSARLPTGSFILIERRCPGRQFQDVTDQFNGRLIFVDIGVQGAPTTTDGDGSHTHSGGEHIHQVEGTTSPLGGGQRKGTLGSDTTVPHERTTLRVSGTAVSTGHSHQGGAHQHSAVGFRLCKVLY